MYNLKLANIYQYLLQWNWFYELSLKMKTYSIILWFALSFYCPLITFGFVLLISILLNSYLQLSTQTCLLYHSTMFQVCLSNCILCTLILCVLSYITFQHSICTQIIQIKINYKCYQRSQLINKTYAHSISTNILDKLPISYFFLKQYIILIGFLYFCRLLKITTHEEELIMIYLSLLAFSKLNDINRLLFCFSLTKQYKYLMLDKITNILCSIKFRNLDFYRLNFIYDWMHLTIFYLEIFINKILVYSQIISECLYSRELTSKESLEST